MLGAVSPAFDSLDERLVLRAAAEIAARDVGTRLEPTFGEIESIARRLAAAPDELRRRVVDRYRDYATRLSLIDLHDHDLEDRNQLRRLARPAISATVLFFAGPLLFLATLIHLPALLVIRAATSAARDPVKKGTTRLLVGLFTGLVTWVVAGALLADGWRAWLAAVAVAAGGALALATFAPLVVLARRLVGRFRTFDRRQLAEDSRIDRAELVDSIGAVTDPADPILPSVPNSD